MAAVFYTMGRLAASRGSGDTPAVRGLMGSFGMMPLQELVEFLARRKMTGSLTCERGTIRKTSYVEGGVVVGSASNDAREFLGRLLVNFGHLTEEQLAKALQTQEETKVRLGKVLAMVGLVPPQVIRDTLALQSREALLDAFLWDSGVFSVDDALPPPVDDLDARVPLSEIAQEAEFRTTAWRAFRAQFPTGTATLRVHEAAVPAELAPAGVDARLLQLARDGSTIDEIGLALHATDFHLYQRLYALHRQGLVEAAPVQSALPLGRALAEAPGTAEGDLTAQLRSVLLDPPCRPRLKVPAHEVPLMRLTASEKYLLGRCDGTRDLQQIVALAPLAESDVLRAVKRFVDARLVELGG